MSYKYSSIKQTTTCLPLSIDQLGDDLKAELEKGQEMTKQVLSLLNQSQRSEVVKKESSLTRDNVTYHFTILGFHKKQNSYGEIYISDSRQTAYVFRGTERKAVIKEAKKTILHK
ncbi:hypothetical protein ACQCVP_22670 [Rossellomorea vietnamensis]|uniref:hypothetical protein n=1 Tax=Rossellomorea vietnamensis TaxID=218284 RepID=UPI003CE95EFC